MDASNFNLDNLPDNLELLTFPDESGNSPGSGVASVMATPKERAALWLKRVGMVLVVIGTPTLTHFLEYDWPQTFGLFALCLIWFMAGYAEKDYQWEHEMAEKRG